MKSLFMSGLIAVTLLFAFGVSIAQKHITMTGIFKQQEGMIQFISNQHPGMIYIPVSSVQDPAAMLNVEVEIEATLDESFKGASEKVQQIDITKLEILQDRSGKPTPLPVEPMAPATN